MTMISILSGRVIDPASNFDAVSDVHIAEGHIVALGEAPDGFQAEKQIDAAGQVVCPGLIDLSVRLREPDAEQKGTVQNEIRAASLNGITTLCCPPDSWPVIDNTAVVELLYQRADEVGMAKVLPLAALTRGLEGRYLAEIGALKTAGCIAVSNACQPVQDMEVLRHAMEYAATCDMMLFVQPQEPSLARAGCVHEGAISTRLGLSGIPEVAETIAVAQYLLLIEMIGLRTHFCHLSCARSAEMIQDARARGLPVTADVTTHHLFLTEFDISDYNSHCHVYPPLRSQRDRDGLRQGLLQDGIHAICSDHQPHEADAKRNPFAETAPGISGLDTLLPLVLRFGQESALPLLDTLSLLTSRPAEVLGRSDIGRLQVGQQADICLFDPQHTWTLSEENMHSRGHNSPCLGWALQGRATMTLLDGRIVSG